MKKIIDFILNWPKTIIVLSILITAPLVYVYFHKVFLNSVDIYFEKTDPSIIAYKSFLETYGNEELVLIAVETPAVFTNQSLKIIQGITELAKSADFIQRVFSLTEATHPVGKDGGVTFTPLVPKSDEDLDADTLAELKRSIFTKGKLAENLVSKDAKTTAIILELHPIASNEEKGEMLAQFRLQAEKIAGSHATLYFGGTPYVEHEITSMTQNDDKIFTPLIIVGIFITAILFFKSFPLAVLCLLNLLFTLLWGVGVFTLSGESFNMVTVVMPPILLAIAVADVIHILSHYQIIQQEKGYNPREATYEVVSKLWLPCLFTSLTTGVGFFSFVTATVGPVRTLGLFTFIGIMLAFLITIFVVPCFITVLHEIEAMEWIRGLKDAVSARFARKTKADSVKFTDRITQIAARIAIERYKAIAVMSVIIIAVSLFGTAKVKYDTNFLNYLSSTSHLSESLKYIEEHLCASVPIVLLIKANDPEKDFTHPESLKMIEKIQLDIQNSLSGKYTSFFSIADYLKEMNKAFNNGDDRFHTIPENRLDILDYYELGETDVLERIVSPEKKEVRISFNTFIGSNERAKELIAYGETVLKKMLGQDFSYEYTGTAFLYVGMDRNLRDTQFRSFGLAFIIILMMMFVICKNVKLTLISMVPNLFPILCTFGLMGFLDIPLDVATIMIASVTIGIAVDDTIHFLVWYRRNIFAGMEIKAALYKTFLDAGKPIMITSVILAVSFFILIVGSVKPVRAFGVLTSLSMLFALIGDFFLFPTLILLFKPRMKATKEREGKSFVPSVLSGLKFNLPEKVR